MYGAASKTMTLPNHSPLIGVADEGLANRLSREIERVARGGHVALVSCVAHLCELAGHLEPDAIVLDDELVGSDPLDGLLRQLTATAPVILIAAPERQAEVAAFVVAGTAEFVARVGDFASLAARLVERRVRWTEMSASMLELPWGEANTDLGTIFRHEINNPLTGILGNAELVLSHRERLSAVDVQRLETVVDLAVRLRETVRRLSTAWEKQHAPAKSA
jgi:signal transduction histidine kinase